MTDYGSRRGVQGSQKRGAYVTSLVGYSSCRLERPRDWLIARYITDDSGDLYRPFTVVNSYSHPFRILNAYGHQKVNSP